jgi:hypothetical protein
MPIALVVGPAVALIGIVSVFFVLRRKSVDKRSMYSARRSQIEHKVRAARQRTLTPRSRPEPPAEAPPPPPPSSIFAPTQAAPTITYQPAAYQPPPVVAPPAPFASPEGAERSPWDIGPTAPAPAEAPAPPTPPPFVPPPEPEPFTPAPFMPEPQPAFEAAPAPGEPAWTPGPAPSEPAGPIAIEPAQPAAAAASAGAGAGWSVVDDSKDAAMATPEPAKKDKKEKKGGATGSWSLASGDAPGTEPDGQPVKTPSPAIAIAQYAVLVVGLVMVLIGVLVMVANAHVT